jgi:hypothetical protein
MQGGQVRDALLALEDEEVALRGNAEVRGWCDWRQYNVYEGSPGESDCSGLISNAMNPC